MSMASRVFLALTLSAAAALAQVRIPLTDLGADSYSVSFRSSLGGRLELHAIRSCRGWAGACRAHERSFYTQVLAGSQFRILCSRDGTRALLFFREGRNKVGNIPSGALELSWTFDGNIMPEEPIVRRMDSDRSEVTAIVFTRSAVA